MGRDRSSHGIEDQRSGLRSQLETRSVGPSFSIEDSFLVVGDMLKIKNYIEDWNC